MSDAALRVLFVCTGNTCRSPMAEGLLREAGRDVDLVTSSAGIAAMPGGAASRETLAILHERGLELEGFTSQSVGEELLAEATHVFCMTRGHLETLEMLYPDLAEKYYLVCEFAEIDGVASRDVPDPIGQGAAAYQKVAECLDQAIVGILGFLRAQQASTAE